MNHIILDENLNIISEDDLEYEFECTECGKNYKIPPNICECGNDSYKELS